MSASERSTLVPNRGHPRAQSRELTLSLGGNNATASPAPARPTPVLQTVTLVLEQARQPMRAREIHAAAEFLVVERLHWSSVKASGGRREYAQVASEDLQRCGKGTLLAMLREIAHLDIRGRLGEIAAPTLVLCGARDRPNIPGSRELAAGIPGAELRIIPGANHLWNLQQPELFNQTVDRFVGPGLR